MIAAIALWLARGTADAALLSAFGACLSLAWLAPPVLAGSSEVQVVAARLARICWLAVAGSVLLTLAWLALQTVALSGSVADAPVVLGQTLFGHVVLTRLALLVLAGLLLASRWSLLAAAAAGLALATQAGHGHGFAMYEGPSWLLLSAVLHLLAAGAWLGSLLPLLVLIASVPPDAAMLASRRFAQLGTLAVLVLAGSASYQGSVLVGSLPGWIGTGYGRVALAKAALLLVLLTFAARNRFRLTPALDAAAPPRAKTRLLRSIAGETCVGLLIVLAAALLTSLPPGMHEQPGPPTHAGMRM